MLKVGKLGHTVVSCVHVDVSYESQNLHIGFVWGVACSILRYDERLERAPNVESLEEFEIIRVCHVVLWRHFKIWLLLGIGLPNPLMRMRRSCPFFKWLYSRLFSLTNGIGFCPSLNWFKLTRNTLWARGDERWTRPWPPCATLHNLDA